MFYGVKKETSGMKCVKHDIKTSLSVFRKVMALKARLLIFLLILNGFN